MKIIIKLDNYFHLMLPATPAIFEALSGIKRVTESSGRYLPDEEQKALSFVLADDAMCAELTAEEKRVKEAADEASKRWYSEFSARSAAEKKVKELEAKLAAVAPEQPA